MTVFLSKPVYFTTKTFIPNSDPFPSKSDSPLTSFLDFQYHLLRAQLLGRTTPLFSIQVASVESLGYFPSLRLSDSRDVMNAHSNRQLLRRDKLILCPEFINEAICCCLPFC